MCADEFPEYNQLLLPTKQTEMALRTIIAFTAVLRRLFYSRKTSVAMGQCSLFVPSGVLEPCERRDAG